MSSHIWFLRFWLSLEYHIGHACSQDEHDKSFDQARFSFRIHVPGTCFDNLSGKEKKSFSKKN